MMPVQPAWRSPWRFTPRRNTGRHLTRILTTCWWKWRQLFEVYEFFFLVDDDARCHHHQQAGRLAAIADIFENAVQVRNLAQHRRAELVALFGQRLEAAEQNRAAVRHRHRGLHAD